MAGVLVFLSPERLPIGPSWEGFRDPASLRRGAEGFHDLEEIHPSNIPQERPPPPAHFAGARRRRGASEETLNLTPPTSAIFTAIIC